jgi:hypothetical protein
MKVNFVEVIPDPKLKKKEEAVTKAVKRLYPDCGPVKLYRTADGRVGFQIQIVVEAGDRKRLEEVYRVVTKALGEKRGRPRGAKTVQAKLHLPKPVYSALKKAAEDSHTTMSGIVTESLRAHLRT